MREGDAGRIGRAARFWRSPEDQPPWARPALLALAVAAGAAYAWGMNGAALETFYGAAARSMSASWHDFIFGSFDPAGTVTVDKLPGALWPQALSLRIFGFHVWAVVLPQAIEGVIAVLVLYRAVRRLAGPLAGIVAAAVLTASPVTVALNRGNVADSLLIVLLVLAADATSAALLSGRLRTLLAAGVWVGLAFQAKMGVAWLVLPALAAAYLLAAPPATRTRILHVLLAGLACLAVSLSWIAAVSLVPAHDRPYVDGTQDDSLISQTFRYNGSARLEHNSVYAGAGHPAPFLLRLSEANTAPTHKSKPGWSRLLGGVFGRDDGWLLPAAAFAAIAVLLTRRRAPREDPLRAALVLWGGWLAVLAVFFSAAAYPNSYYVAGLAPATGALCGLGVEIAWRARRRRAASAWLAAALLCCIAYGVHLLDGGTAVPAWLVPLALAAGVLGAGALLLGNGVRLPGIGVRLRGARTSAATGTPGLTRARVGVALACALVLPGVASLLMVTRGLGPFAAPFEPASATISRAAAASALRLDAGVVEEAASAYGTPIAFATDSSVLAAPFILASGSEVLPIGGFQGGVPAPTLAQLERYVSEGRVRAFLLPTVSDDPRVLWLRAHCPRPPGAAPAGGGATSTALYECAAR